MFFADGHRPDPRQVQAAPKGGSKTYLEWLESKPGTGEALVDTGLSSAADCQKLRWSLNQDQEDQFRRLMAKSVARDKELFRLGGLEAEAKRINDLAGSVLKEHGLDPASFGISMPEQLPGQG